MDLTFDIFKEMVLLAYPFADWEFREYEISYEANIDSITIRYLKDKPDNKKRSKYKWLVSTKDMTKGYDSLYELIRPITNFQRTVLSMFPHIQWDFVEKNKANSSTAVIEYNPSKEFSWSVSMAYLEDYYTVGGVLK